MLLNNEWINNEEIKKYLETNENEHTITHSIAIQTYQQNKPQHTQDN